MTSASPDLAKTVTQEDPAPVRTHRSPGSDLQRSGTPKFSVTAKQESRGFPAAAGQTVT
jgi:hypothetical protein